VLASNDIVVFMLASARGPRDADVAQGSLHHRKWEGARRQLVARGLIDPARCGLMGWSSTGQEISFLLTHPGPDPHWAAAVVVDGWTGHNYATVMMEFANDVQGKFEWRANGLGDRI
jgi:hypothetical protein